MAKKKETAAIGPHSAKRKRPYPLTEIREFSESLRAQAEKFDGLVARMEKAGIESIEMRGVSTNEKILKEIRRFSKNVAGGIEEAT